ncbi:shikimate dehydrogenase [Flavobacteriaceae bacterium F89]|uniref:Shikimate dehydrogenase n=1 Tax=Cerina litoralis TaxID=2874477 RepID=A0AAE3JNH9_9FLAO|nr:shikimate dehydrogenase [Cerina litoralis]MCG2459886.1 shikimate dehydrogenase [Cerina litoralis]
MGKKENKNNRFGLVGRNISYSFSKGYFTEKFSVLGLDDYTYENFDLEKIEDFSSLITNNPNIKGVNVTIPYKEAVLPYLSEIHPKAAQIGAVNTIKLHKDQRIGFNTDVYGFRKAIEQFLKPHHKKALILGTGGASKAVAFVFDELNLPFQFVSRNPKANQLNYSDLDHRNMKEYTVLVNCTPLGTFPKVEDRPSIPYQSIGDNHLLFDLIYNPPKTSFLIEGESRGATISNGLRMLQLQAEKAWEIWNT